MTDNRNLLELTAEEKRDLERWAQSRSLPAGDVFRARLILALAYCKSYREIENGMRISAVTIVRWRTRFKKDRSAGLGEVGIAAAGAVGDGPKAGRIGLITPPCGVPRSRSMTSPSFSIDATSHRPM